MLRFVVGETYDCPKVTRHGLNKDGKAYTMMQFFETTRSKNKFDKTVWVEGAPECKEGDKFTITAIKSVVDTRTKGQDGNWHDVHSMGIEAEITPCEDAPAEVEEVKGNTVLFDEDDDGELPW